MITVDRADLAALVELLEREHFAYNARGAAALRAYRQLAAAAEHFPAGAVAITPIADVDPDQHEG